MDDGDDASIVISLRHACPGGGDVCVCVCACVCMYIRVCAGV